MTSQPPNVLALPEHELKALADDLKATSLHHPLLVVVGVDGVPMLIDGRDRLEACRTPPRDGGSKR